MQDFPGMLANYLHKGVLPFPVNSLKTSNLTGQSLHILSLHNFKELDKKLDNSESQYLIKSLSSMKF